MSQVLVVTSGKGGVGKTTSTASLGAALANDGAKVVVIAGSRRLAAQRIGGGSYQAASDSRFHFCLEQVDRIEAIEITWPSGSVDRHFALPPGSGYLLYEGENKPRPLPGYPTIAPRH